MSHPAGPAELEVEFPAKPEYVRTVRHAVGALAHLHGMPEDVVEDAKLAVSEAVTHALGSGVRDPGEVGPLLLAASGGPAYLEISILDRGPGPEREVAGAPSDISTGELPFERAVSLPLIRGLVDELEIAAREGGGSAIRMRIGAEGRPDG